MYTFCFIINIIKMYKCVIIKGKPKNPKYTIHLYNYENHFCVITSMPAFFGRTYFCESCNKPYAGKGQHKCKNKCSACHFEPPCIRMTTLNCQDCNRLFKNKKCFENHKKVDIPTKVLAVRTASLACKRKLASATNGKANKIHERSICERFCRCTTCFKQFLTKDIDKHNCGFTKCRFCKEEVILKG